MALFVALEFTSCGIIVIHAHPRKPSNDARLVHASSLVEHGQPAVSNPAKPPFSGSNPLAASRIFRNTPLKARDAARPDPPA